MNSEKLKKLVRLSKEVGKLEAKVASGVRSSKQQRERLSSKRDKLTNMMEELEND